MKILHIVGYNPKKINGLGNVVLNLFSEQNKLGHDVRIYNISRGAIINSNNEETKISLWKLFSHFVPDLVVFHVLYSVKYLIFSYLLRIKRIPYIIFPHGGMTSDNHKKYRFKKTLVDIIAYKNYIKHSSGIINLNEAEKDDDFFSNIGPTRYIIPNGVKLPKSYSFITENDGVKLVFLSRIDIYHKGIDLLISSIKSAQDFYKTNDVSVHIYGFGKESEITTLKQWIKELGLPNITYAGAVYDEDKKSEIFNSADIFILTSRYEGMPIAILEALSYGVPCFVTDKTNMSDLIFKHDCGWVTNTNPKEIAHDLIGAITDYRINKKKYRENARQSVAALDWSAIAAKSVEVYDKINKRQTSNG